MVRPRVFAGVWRFFSSEAARPAQGGLDDGSLGDVLGVRLIRRTWWIAAAALALWFGLGILGAQKACAHDPRFACSPRDEAHAIVIPDAGKSWAYYGHLASGQMDAYTFTLARRARVPFSVLVAQGDADADPGRPALAVKDARGVMIARTDLSKGEDFYEPFSRVDYLKSPDIVMDLEPGSYSLTVEMRGSSGLQRYVLAVGEAERFSVGELPYVLGAIARIRAMRY